MKPIYLDHNATTQIEESAQTALLFFSSTALAEAPNYGNVSSIHWAGRRLKAALDEARQNVAELLGVENAEELCFTSGATESINTALKGLFFHHLEQGQEPADFHLFTSLAEHDATLETARFLARLGADVFYCPVDSEGRLDLAALERALLERAEKGQRVLSFLAANNETGVISPLVELSALAARFKAIFHIDAVQALGKMPFSLLTIRADLVSVSAHKIGGPKGVGALYVKRGLKLANLLHGGVQERKRRAGTINMAGCAAFGAAAKALRAREVSADLRDYFEQRLQQEIAGVHFHGRAATRISNTSNFIFDGVRGEGLVMGLDLAGFAVSSGSACNSGSILPSHVLLAMGFDKSAAASAVRVSLASSNTRSEIDAFLQALGPLVTRMREQAQRKTTNLKTSYMPPLGGRS